MIYVPGHLCVTQTSVRVTSHLSQYRPKSCHGSYLIPENFQQRNIQLIQSIKEFLQSDESKFNKFKTHSGQFRQVSGFPKPPFLGGLNSSGGFFKR